MGLFRNYADDLELMEWLETAIYSTEAKLNDDYVRYGTITLALRKCCVLALQPLATCSL